MELYCAVQNYEWGKLGSSSTVAKLYSNANPGYTIDPQKPYAELWMGTHPNGPSLIIERDILLAEYLKDNPDAIGPDVKKKFGISIPFLLKVLSIKKALSIQAHPTKEHAEHLNRNFPDIYKDSNHKPELAIALTPFESLCGFRPVVEIQEYLKNIPELMQVLPQEKLDGFLKSDGSNLKGLFHSLMTCDKNKIMLSLQNFLSRLESKGDTIETLFPLIQRLHKDFPGDVGCWAPFFMNYITLQPGQAVFLKPNLPHAYLSGDCVECMACSDNVVRAGLTPKLIDVPTLIDMLDYTSYTKQDLIFVPHLEDGNSCIWRPPVPDFAVVKIKVAGGDSYNTKVRASPSIIIIMSGEGEANDTEPVKVTAGVVLFLKASRQLTLTPSVGSHLEAYQAICNV